MVSRTCRSKSIDRLAGPHIGGGLGGEFRSETAGEGFTCIHCGCICDVIKVPPGGGVISPRVERLPVTFLAVGRDPEAFKRLGSGSVESLNFVPDAPEGNLVVMSAREDAAKPEDHGLIVDEETEPPRSKQRFVSA